MNRTWFEILDHGDDPGRYTLVQGDGMIYTCNEDGSVICSRKCHNPYGVVGGLSREKGVRIVKPTQAAELIKKIDQHLKPQVDEN